jgi:hypothetical protein
MTSGSFVRDVLELPLIAENIISHLPDPIDRICFGCISKDPRFQEAIAPSISGARFVLDMQSFYSKWEIADEEYADLLDALDDVRVQDNVLIEREHFFVGRLMELCQYLKKNWSLVEASTLFQHAIYRKIEEMIDTFVTFEIVGGLFLKEMFSG